jgi:hypothetical protein
MLQKWMDGWMDDLVATANLFDLRLSRRLGLRRNCAALPVVISNSSFVRRPTLIETNPVRLLSEHLVARCTVTG